MRSILNLFSQSPFNPLLAHMEKVSACVQLLPALFNALKNHQEDLLAKIAQEISAREHEADLTKNSIRNQLPKDLYLPIAHSSLLEILALQDSIADKAEDVAVLLTLRSLPLLDPFWENFQAFLHKNIEAFESAHSIIKEFHVLLEASFGGIEAKKVRAMVDGVAFKEHEADLLQRKVLKELFNAEDKLTISTFHVWQRILESIGALSNLSEKLANRICMTLET
jgi:predicted phosphate transport protein (TIGR00153 family)